LPILIVAASTDLASRCGMAGRITLTDQSLAVRLAPYKRCETR
jgi:hypothetical protein